MKVLLAAPASGASGGINRWTKHILAYYNSLQNKPVCLDVFDLARSGFIPDDISLLPRLRLAWKDYRAILNRFKTQLKKNEYDIVHITSSAGLGLFRDLLMIKYARKKGVKTIIHYRFGRIPQLADIKNWEWTLLMRVVRKADGVIVLDKRSFETLTRTSATNISLLPNMIAPGVAKQIEDCKGTQRIPRRILFVGHCISTKGVYELVKACKSISNIRLVLMGAIKEDVKIELQKIVNYGEWLEIKGERPYNEVIDEMLSCGLFVLPTYTEGFPNVIVEAMASGCSIITTPVGAIPDMLDIESELPCGICVPIKDANALRVAIVDLLGRPKDAELYGDRAKRRVNEEYSMSAIWKQLVYIWEGTNNGF